MSTGLNELLFLLTDEAKQLEKEIKTTKKNILSDYKLKIVKVSELHLSICQSNKMYKELIDLYNQRINNELKPLQERFELLKRNFSVKEFLKLKK